MEVSLSQHLSSLEWRIMGLLKAANNNTNAILVVDMSVFISTVPLQSSTRHLNESHENIVVF